MSRWFFDIVAPWYEPIATPLTVGDPARVLTRIDLPDRAKVLDIGGGTGALARAIVESTNAHVTVLDASERMLAQLPRHPRLKGHHGVAHSLPFHAETFDWVICTAAFHWLTPHETTLAAMRRVLKPGGGLYLQDFDRAGLVGTWLAQLEGWLRQGAHYLSADELARLLTEQGFSGRLMHHDLAQIAFVGRKEL